MTRLLSLPGLFLFVVLPAVAHAQEKIVEHYNAGMRVTIMQLGPYLSGGGLGLVLAANKCMTQLREDCFFWTPPGCDGVSSYPVLSNTSLQQVPFCVDPLLCHFHTYCSGTCRTYCELIGPEEPPSNCPIVIPLGPDHKARFTDLARGVQFDIDADGIKDRISWTDPRSHTVFLALDRDGDGVVTNGSELFGNHTEQLPSADPNGFIALAELDYAPAGGNGDGVISVDDAMFSDLLLWDDANHDGQSQPDELRPLAEGGVVAIKLHYHATHRYDQFGNYLRYFTRVELVDGRTRAIDVFFLGE